MLSLHTSATGMLASETAIDVIANNLANQSTSGYKRKRAEFEDLLYVSKERVGVQSSDSGTVRPAGVDVGLGVTTSAIYSINEQGVLEKTDGKLDVAVNGRGFFRVTLPSGEEAYTRSGTFQVNASGEVVTIDGYTVAPGLTIPADATDISINSSGEVLATIDGQVAPTNVGQFELVNFINETGLQSIGANLLQETDASGAPISGIPGDPGFGTVLQGFIEGSNVNSVTELTNLIKAQRAFEMNVKVMEKTDQNAQTFNQAV